MTNRRAPAFDRLLTYGMFDVTSAISVRYPDSRFAKKVAGDNPVRWHAVRTHADDVPEWITTPRDRDAGFLHSTITVGRLLAAPNDEVDRAKAALEQEYGGVAVAAAAFRVGKAVVTAEIPEYQEDGQTASPDIPNHVSAILGVGNGALRATVGAYHQGANEFMGAELLIAPDPAYLQDLVAVYPNTPRL